MNLQTIEELHKRNSDSSYPVMIDVQHDYIIWSKKLLETGQYENGHLRLINDTRGVLYQGKYYFPSSFSYTPPTDEGKAETKASISISAIDSSIRTIINNITSGATATITTVFEKVSLNEVVFYPIRSVVFSMGDIDYDKLRAKWNLFSDNVLSLNIPRVLGTIQRCPSAEN